MTMNKHVYVVILAGGVGTRFWPLSREAQPKQFLKIIGSRSLLQQTLWRIKSKVYPQNTFIVTNAAYRQKIEQQTVPFKIPPANILLEPEGKNTAPAIAWAATYIDKMSSDAIMAVLPSDHLIFNEPRFLKVFDEAIQLANQDYLVTLGIIPTRPETGYGYLKLQPIRENGKTIYRVQRFTEKPTLKKAKQFLQEKRYLWNSGMFFWKTKTILDEFKKYLPVVYKLFKHQCNSQYARSIWSKLPSISIDYGILEKSQKVVTVSVKNIGWSDLGSWEALAESLDKNRQGNIFKGNNVSLDCQNIFVVGQKRLIATIGLKDIIIVDTSDALLVCPLKQSQKVKETVSVLKKTKRDKYL